MNPEPKRLWVEALRSGKFKQGKSALKQRCGDGEPEYCCLGVLCEVAIRAGVNVRVREADGSESFLSTYDGQSGYLPRAVSDWAGLQGYCPVLGEDTATHYNDAEGKTFGEIADLIEQYL